MFQLHLTGSIEIIAELDFTYGFDLIVSFILYDSVILKTSTNEQNSTRFRTMLQYS
jgi:hypothetical protein